VSVQRYECDCHPGNPCDDGEWVRYEDHAATVDLLEEELADLRELCLKAKRELERRGCRSDLISSLWQAALRPRAEGGKESR
jgi:hypothetical protein